MKEIYVFGASQSNSGRTVDLQFTEYHHPKKNLFILEFSKGNFVLKNDIPNYLLPF